MLRDEKFVVFKREDWDRWVLMVAGEDHEHPESYAPHFLSENTVKDATVIRCQDIFAAPALSAYADTITTALEISDLFPREANGQVRSALQRSADFFHERAEEARGWPHKKLPD